MVDISLSLCAFFDTCLMRGAKVERERIAIRQEAAKECPPKYPQRRCVKSAEACKICWAEWLEANE